MRIPASVTGPLRPVFSACLFEFDFLLNKIFGHFCSNWIQLVWLHALGLLGGLELILPICRLHESLPDVQLIIRRLPPRQEASLAVLLVASWE